MNLLTKPRAAAATTITTSSPILTPVDKAQIAVDQAAARVEAASLELAASSVELAAGRGELAAFKNELAAFKTSLLVPEYFSVDYSGGQSYLRFLSQNIQDREAALKDRAAALKDRAAALKDREAELKDREAALKDGAAELKDREAALTDGAAELEDKWEQQGKARKRIHIGPTGSAGSDSVNAGTSQSAFRARLLERDGVCLVTKLQGDLCQAAHIVPKYPFRNDVSGIYLWDITFANCCKVTDRRVMDVRNGLLLSPTLRKTFGNFLWTLKPRQPGSNEFKVEVHTWATLPELKDKSIIFNEAKKDEWPHEQFLKFHNDCFHSKQFTLKAGAGAQSLDHGSSDESNDEVDEKEDDDFKQTFVDGGDNGHLDARERTRAWLQDISP